MVIGLMFSILSIAVPVVLVVWAVRQFGNRTGSRGTDAHSIRRFFQYLLLYGLMIVAAVGLSDLLGLLFQEPSLAGDDNSALARALTFSVFGIPMFVLLTVWSRRHLKQDPDEARSLGWAFYATVAPLTALVVAMTALHGVVSAALADQRFDGSALSQFVVWGAVWLVHWIVANRMLDADRRQGQLVLGSLIGLGTTVAGLVGLLGASLDALLVDQANTLLIQQQDPLAQAAATVVVGVPVWVVYWLRNLSKARRTPLWFGYVLPVGVGGSLVLAVVGASIVLYQLLVWLIGEPASTQAAQHFEGAPTAGACVIVGAVSWWYHRQVFTGATPARMEVTRVYEYLMAGIALLAAAVGVTMVVVALVESLVPPAAVEVGTSVVNSLLSGVTLLLVGGPLWLVFWTRIGRATRDGDPDDLSSPTRRIYLFVLFGLGGRRCSRGSPGCRVPRDPGRAAEWLRCPGGARDAHTGRHPARDRCHLRLPLGCLPSRPVAAAGDGASARPALRTPRRCPRWHHPWRGRTAHRRPGGPVGARRRPGRALGGRRRGRRGEPSRSGRGRRRGGAVGARDDRDAAPVDRTMSR